MGFPSHKAVNAKRGATSGLLRLLSIWAAAILLVVFSALPTMALAAEGKWDEKYVPGGAFKPFPEFTSYVVDNARILSPKTREKLEKKLSAFALKYRSQVAVLTVTSVWDEKIEDYALRVADTWGIGRRGVEDGLVIVVAADTGNIGFGVRPGLKKTIDDELIQYIVRYDVAPNFQRRDVDDGVMDAVDSILGHIEEAVPSGKLHVEGWRMPFFIPLIVLFMSYLVKEMVGVRYIGLAVAGLAGVTVLCIVSLFVDIDLVSLLLMYFGFSIVWKIRSLIARQTGDGGETGGGGGDWGGDCGDGGCGD